MKAKHVIVYLLLAIFSSSCIREEAPNAEADILQIAGSSHDNKPDHH